MKKLLLACVSTVGFCGFLATANATTLHATPPTVAVSSIMAGSPSDLPYRLAKAQGTIQVLQNEVHNLNTQIASNGTDPQYFFSVAPPPNADGSPISTGG
jgi:hypothetical protein